VQATSKTTIKKKKKKKKKWSKVVSNYVSLKNFSSLALQMNAVQQQMQEITLLATRKKINLSTQKFFTTTRHRQASTKA
jgi:uncharacterized protein YlbG (UPF0298 family)